MHEDLLKKMLEVQQIQRHNFMNYLQIIGGYLQLGNLEKSKDYLMQVEKSLRNYRHLSTIPLVCLQSFLLWCVTKFNTSGQIFEVVLNGTWHGWEDVDGELTYVLRELLLSVQDNLINNDLQCKFSFLDNSFGFSLVFVGREDVLRCLKEKNINSSMLSVVWGEKITEKLVIAIKRR